MPWKVKEVVEQRIEFVIRARRKEAPLRRLCEEYGISRPTGYACLRRYAEAGSLAALAPRSRRPHTSPSRTAEEEELAVVRLRKRHGWGARKLPVLLAEEGCHLTEPTINRMLRRRGLQTPRKGPGRAPGRFERPACTQALAAGLQGRVPGG